ncbi:hypothetical protein GP2143_14041 [marine gamma proteobacterium HTCC2143]|uniref:Uncharacterized protein n=1 Tax=marine gamma proteobacterium HTCC2143 TaxID=247633 RepID=A0Y8C8_9GAMM|nr:hypothetical protein GP2143_14041 [marine gamma proteobacterium HTCC2143]
MWVGLIPDYTRLYLSLLIDLSIVKNRAAGDQEYQQIEGLISLVTQYFRNQIGSY